MRPRLGAWLPILMALAAGLTLLLWCALAVVADPSVQQQHCCLGAPIPETPAAAVRLEGDASDGAEIGDPDALSVEMLGTVYASGSLDHAGYTLCAGRCTTAPPLRSRDLRLASLARWTVAGAWTLDGAPSLLAEIGAGAPLLEVRGALTLPDEPLTVSVSGTPPYLPALLISARSLAGAVAPGALPAGTALDVRSGAGFVLVYLVTSP